MTIEDKKFVSLTYELKLESKENEAFEVVSEEKPLEFIAGIGKMLPKFEEKLYGLKANDNFDFSLAPDESYGEYKDQMIVDVPVDIFKKDGVIDTNILKVDNVVPMRMKDGHVMHGTIKSFDDKNVVMDFNHILAGKTLFFSGKILGIREATKEELTDTGHKCTGCGKH